LNTLLRAGLMLFSILASVPAGAADTMTVAYLELIGDPRYREKAIEARYLGKPWGRPFAGADAARRESKFVGSAIGVDFQLERIEGKDAAELIEQVQSLPGSPVSFVLADLPAQVLSQVAEGLSDLPLLVLNVSAPDDTLRQASCQTNLLHVFPSYAMLSDALAQFLVSQKWREVLVLEGPLETDRQLVQAFDRSAKRYGLEITEKRNFLLGTDPRKREQNNLALLTRGDYDVVFVADTEGEFARGLPYRTLQPRPVVGTEGLAPLAWHWAWERHGAPQLNNRFLKRAKREQTGYDWAAWMAYKAVVEATLRVGSTDFEAVSAYLRGQDIVLDGFKGNRLSFRPWSNQLRQPILLGTHNWVIDRAPIQGFLHASNNLDTLGYDQRETLCEQ